MIGWSFFSPASLPWNSFRVIALSSMIVLQLMLTYWTPLSATFQTTPIGLVQWLEIIAFALFSSLIIALEKYWTRRERST